MFKKIKQIFQRKEDITEDFEDFAWLISVLDSYRIGKRVKRSLLREKLRKVNKKFSIPSINRIYSDIEYIRTIAEKKEPKMDFYSKLLYFTQPLIEKPLVFVGLTIIVILLFPVWFLLLIVFLVWAVVLIRWYVRGKIRKIYIKYQGMYKENQQNIGEYVQELIDTMKKYLEKRNEPAKKYPLLLHYKNYKNVKLKRSPGIFNEYYVCIVDIKSG